MAETKQKRILSTEIRSRINRLAHIRALLAEAQAKASLTAELQGLIAAGADPGAVEQALQRLERKAAP